MRELERYSITPPNSINRHSVRVFEAQSGRRVALDRTLDGVPPFFNAYELPQESSQTLRVPRPVLVDGAQYWGDGWTWTVAIRALESALTITA